MCHCLHLALIRTIIHMETEKKWDFLNKFSQTSKAAEDTMVCGYFQRCPKSPGTQSCALPCPTPFSHSGKQPCSPGWEETTTEQALICHDQIFLGMFLQPWSPSITVNFFLLLQHGHSLLCFLSLATWNQLQVNLKSGPIMLGVSPAHPL